MLLILSLLVTRVISEKLYLQATVLFYGDELNRTVLITGPLPKVLDAIITKDLEFKTPSDVQPIVKVVPVYNYVSDIPSDDPHDVYEKLLKAYPNLIKADFPEHTRKYFKLKARSNKNNDSNISPEDKNSSKVYYFIPNNNETNSENITTTPDYSKFTQVTPYVLGPEKFVPNDIYYAVEKKCTNWADNCGQKSGSFLSTPLKSLFMPQNFFMKKFVFDP